VLARDLLKLSLKQEGLIMNSAVFLKNNLKKTGIAILMIAAILFASSPAFGHGGKTHAENSFTPLQALQKATQMYDQLVSTNRLDEGWETGLVKVEISILEQNGKKEFAVVFYRLEKSPQTVYFFFSADGKYTGSNFTGK
jgi:hypothetical protein